MELFDEMKQVPKTEGKVLYIRATFPAHPPPIRWTTLGNKLRRAQLVGGWLLSFDAKDDKIKRPVFAWLIKVPDTINWGSVSFSVSDEVC